MKRYPLLLKPAVKSAIWGGSALSSGYGKEMCGENIAETWELSVRDGAHSVIENGAARGLTLAEYIEKAGRDVVCPSYGGEKFPLLIKFIDAAKPLSVQVHPDDPAAERLEGDVGKTEMWYIVEAKPGAEIVYGLKDGVTREDFAFAVAAGQTERVLKSVPVSAGEAYFIPAGLIHAIGGGIVVAEIQQNSDLTYRVYDYGRLQADGSPRELHVEKALEVTKILTDGDISAARFKDGAPAKNGGGCLPLADSEYFRVGKIALNPGEKMSLAAGADSFTSLLCLLGRAKILWNGESFGIEKGDCFFLPAGLGEYRISATEKVEILETKINY